MASDDDAIGDEGGLVVMSQAVEEEAPVKAHRKVSAEDRTRDELLVGRSLQRVYDTCGVL